MEAQNFVAHFYKLYVSSNSDDTVMVLGESSFWFRFRSTIQFLPLWSMDDKAEAEPRPLLAKYYL